MRLMGESASRNTNIFAVRNFSSIQHWGCRCMGCSVCSGALSKQMPARALAGQLPACGCGVIQNQLELLRKRLRMCLPPFVSHTPSWVRQKPFQPAKRPQGCLG